MSTLTFINDSGDFVLTKAQRYPGTYFPLANEAGMISSVTAMLSGDCKTGQNSYLLPPASAETLHESRASRNFWILEEGRAPWSVAGQSALQQAGRLSEDEEDTTLFGGLLWQGIERVRKRSGLRASVLSFVPAGDEKVEIMQVTLSNEGSTSLELTPVAAIPVYGRSADNIRDHRHVTSLLQRVEGGEVAAALFFPTVILKPGDMRRYQIVLAVDANPAPYLSPDTVRDDLVSYFAGVRTDGTNATIIGSAPGEFKADRNNIPRVWMDHGFWPLFTVALYIDERGQGMYPYLTAAASWLLLTLQTQVFGVRGRRGDLELSPKLTAALFDEDGVAEIECTAAGRRVHVRYLNSDGLDWGSYRIAAVTCGVRSWTGEGTTVLIPDEDLPKNVPLDFVVMFAEKQNIELPT